MRKAELVFVPAPGISHVVSTIEFAKCLLDRDDRFSMTILVICQPGISDVQSSTPVSLDTRIRCINIRPPTEPLTSSNSFEKFISDYIESHKSNVEDAIQTEILSDDSVQLSGIVVDFFCTSMIDVANKFNVPSYLFFTSGAAFLGFMLHLPVHNNQVGALFDLSDKKSIIPSYVNPVPNNVLPPFAFNKDGYTSFLYQGTRFNETKGFIINTLAELEPHAIHSLKMALPPVYPVGPLLDLEVKDNLTGLRSKWDEIITWLDDQPPSSVVFLCFGSRGGFNSPQLEQIAIALEGSRQRFIWSIRRPPQKKTFELPTEYENFQQVLPRGFLERTENKGIVCGWAPQVEVLAHSAIGGFISHCGWNSTLESLWHGVPIATWPLYAEQQMNAFQLVDDLGLAVGLKLDYRLGSGELVMADMIERAINSLMDVNNPVRNRVKKMSEKSRKAVVDGGSSYNSVGGLINDMLKNISVVDT